MKTFVALLIALVANVAFADTTQEVVLLKVLQSRELLTAKPAHIRNAELTTANVQLTQAGRRNRPSEYNVTLYYQYDRGCFAVNTRVIYSETEVRRSDRGYDIREMWQIYPQTGRCPGSR